MRRGFGPLSVFPSSVIGLFCPLTNSEVKYAGERRIVLSTSATMGVIAPSGLRYSLSHGGDGRSENAGSVSLSPATSKGQRTPFLLCFVILLDLSTNLSSDARTRVRVLGRTLYRPHEKSENVRANLPWEPGI